VLLDLDPAFCQRMTDVFGDDGRDWLERLPRIIEEYGERWDLRIEAPLALSYNYVAPATRADGTQAVFKCGVERGPVVCEIAALRHWDGDGAVRLLEADQQAGVFLLDRLSPGVPIIEIDDAEATRIAARLMRRLWRPLPASQSFPTLADWGEVFRLLRTRHDGGTGDLPATAVARGEELYWHLVNTQGEPIVLHGDLHHYNILSAQREPWLIIDPHGVIGEAAFEVGAWLRNPVGGPGEPYEERFLLNQPDPRAVLDRRLRIFAEQLGIERKRLRDWGIAFATISACWSDEASHRAGWEQALAVADLLTTL
jgi:streptomycin 6-kinase